MVWSISSWLLKLENDSSDCLLMGLRCRREGPRGLDGRCMIGRPVVLGTGEECARVICGAVREPLPEDLDLRWPLAKGERVRGRNGKDDMERFENGAGVVGVSGAVDRRGARGRGDSMLGRPGNGFMKGDSSTSSMASSSWREGIMTTGGSDEWGVMMTVQGAGRVTVGRLISRYHHVMTDCLGGHHSGGVECLFGGGRGGVKGNMGIEIGSWMIFGRCF